MLNHVEVSFQDLEGNNYWGNLVDPKHIIKSGIATILNNREGMDTNNIKPEDEFTLNLEEFASQMRIEDFPVCPFNGSNENVKFNDPRCEDEPLMYHLKDYLEEHKNDKFYCNNIKGKTIQLNLKGILFW